MNPEIPKVSILIPAHNEEKHIEQAVESALAQSYQNKEIVVADDASTDNTWQILQKYQSLPDVKIFRNQQNLGRVANHRHLLYDLADGDYAVTLDADDCFIDKDFLVDAVEMAVNNNLRLVFAEANVININHQKAAKVRYPFTKTGILAYPEIFKKGVLFMHGAVFYRRDLALQSDFYSKDIIADDNESFLRFIIGEKIGFLKHSVYLYRQETRAERYTIEARLQNNQMVESVYQHALKVSPQEPALFDLWRDRMLATFFYGNLINLGFGRKVRSLIEYLWRYPQKYGLKRTLLVLKHPLIACLWGYCRS